MSEFEWAARDLWDPETVQFSRELSAEPIVAGQRVIGRPADELNPLSGPESATDQRRSVAHWPVLAVWRLKC